MGVDQKIFFGLKIWAFVALCFVMLHSIKGRKSVSLPLIFFSDLSINHLLGAIIYVFPWYIPQNGYILNYTAEQVAEGFLQTSYGLLAFLAGMITLTLIRKKSPLKVSNQIPLNKMAGKIFGLGALFYFLLKPLTQIPGLSTISTSGWVLMQCGICLALWDSYRQGNKKRFAVWFTIGLILFPSYTILTTGAIEFAIKAILVIICFVSIFYRPKWHLICATPLILFVGLTFFVNYMQVRNEIRQAAYSNDVVKERIEIVKKAYRDKSFFNFRDSRHLELIDIRLNQNCFVGMVVDNIEAGLNDFARGATIVRAVQAMIPRVIWRNKPVIGGGGTLFAEYTGFEIVDDTTFGVGLPLELYINFGTTSIVIGLFIMGLIVTWFDGKAAYGLFQNDSREFLKFFIPGLAMTRTIASLSEISSSVASAFVIFFLVDRFFIRPAANKRVS